MIHIELWHIVKVFREVLILFQDLTQYGIYFNLKNYINGRIIGGKIFLKELLY